MKKISIIRVTTLFFLIPVVLWSVLSCSSSQEKFSLSHQTTDEWNALVDKTIPEQERAAKVKNLGHQMIDLANSMTEQIEKSSEKVTILNENYGTTKEELQNTLSEFVEIRNQTLHKYRDVIFAMRSEVSSEEWQKLTD